MKAARWANGEPTFFPDSPATAAATRREIVGGLELGTTATPAVARVPLQSPALPCRESRSRC